MTGFYVDRPCLGCGRIIGTTDPLQFCCSDCAAAQLEWLASVIAGVYGQRYDPVEEHDIGECGAWLEKLYGKPTAPCRVCKVKHVFGTE